MLDCFGEAGIITPAIAVVSAMIHPQKAGEMRKKENSDHELFDAQYRNFAWAISPKNPLVAELAAIDKLLDEAPEVLDLVAVDLANHDKTVSGRPTEASCEQVLRAAILMRLRRLHYRQIAEEIDASMLYRKFTRFYGKASLKESVG